MPTKRQIILDAYEEIGLGPSAYSPNGADIQSALRRLDALMAQYAGMSAAAGWPYGGGADQETGLPFQYQRAVITGLAVDLAPAVGRSPSPQTLTAAAQGRNLMMRDGVKPLPKALDTLAIPAGQGHKNQYRNNLPNYDTVVTPDERQG